MISIHALREEGDLQSFGYEIKDGDISIHALREEGDVSNLTPEKTDTFISIHALREEGDGQGLDLTVKINLFLSTPSARRATTGSSNGACTSTYFYPRPPRGGRLVALDAVFCNLAISIHALREEGDLRKSTTGRLKRISIHALREEGDATTD